MRAARLESIFSEKPTESATSEEGPEKWRAWAMKVPWGPNGGNGRTSVPREWDRTRAKLRSSKGVWLEPREQP